LYLYFLKISSLLPLICLPWLSQVSAPCVNMGM
jgi:hypothetical protein